MMSILMQSQIESSKSLEKDDTYSLHVERSRLSEAIETLKDHGYPRDSYKSMGEIFKKEGLISSPLEERVRFIYALSQNVEETLTQIDGVITARVHIVLPENNPFADEVNPSSASVFIKFHPDSNLDEVKADIKLIVEKSIEGLSYDKVTVVMLPARKMGALTDNAAQADTSFNGLGFLFLGGLIALAGFFGFRMLFGQAPEEEDDSASKPVGSPLLRINTQQDKAEVETDAGAVRA